MGRVLYFTQTDPLAAEDRRELEGKGWTVKHLQFRRVVMFDLPVVLQGYDVIVVTSKQAARWLTKRPQQPLQNIAAVGGSTSALLPPASLLFGADPPATVADLVNRLRGALSHTDRVLFLKGSHAASLQSRGLTEPSLSEVVVYSMVPAAAKFPPIPEDAMVYFQAPSTVKDFWTYYQRRPGRIGAIGPTTAKAIREQGWAVDFQPSRPENQTFVAELPAAHSPS